MPGPQVGPAIEISSALRDSHPELPIAWGGYFPTLYPDAAINAPYVDFVVRGQGEMTLLEMLERIAGGGNMAGVPGVTWKESMSFDTTRTAISARRTSSHCPCMSASAM